MSSDKWWTCTEFLLEPQVSSQYLLLVVHETECMTPRVKESCMDERTPSTDTFDFSEKTLMICENSDFYDELLSIKANYALA
ncbi:hypothetical protein HNY73_007734 [Argiope bruennichi]|uniref:Uncharacterized protein n=1 Tax=Argiope bruennichi TaxID=94029 RepID=A0A8T0FEW0_ARGBR|nr:hypothetical protein HNY73_007734 [Argiope bruennichi]